MRIFGGDALGVVVVVVVVAQRLTYVKGFRSKAERRAVALREGQERGAELAKHPITAFLCPTLLALKLIASTEFYIDKVTMESQVSIGKFR